MTHDNGLDAGAGEAFLHLVQELFGGLGSDGVNVDALAFQRVKPSGNGRVFMRGGEQGIAGLPFQRSERERVARGGVWGERDAQRIPHPEEGADSLPA